MGGDISFDTYADLEKAYADESLFPADLKIGVTDAINNMLEPIRKELDTDEVRSIIAKGYPPEKKQKKKGGKPIQRDPKAVRNFRIDRKHYENCMDGPIPADFF